MTETIRTTGIGALVLRKRPDGEALGYAALVVGRCSLDEPLRVAEKLGFRLDHSTTEADQEVAWMVCDR